VSNREDDWGNDSASLFRETRRAHDPTPAESARLDAVLARIQAGKAETSFAEDHAADIVVRGVASATLRQIAIVSLGAAFVAAAFFAVTQFNRPPAEPAHGAKPPSTAVASAPQPIAMQPAPALAPVPSGKLSASSQTAAARDEGQSRPRSQRRRWRASAETQRSSPRDMASAPEASSSTPHYPPTSVAMPESGTARQAGAEPASTEKAVAAIQDVAPRARSVESNPTEAVTAAARKADPMLPENAPTELAMMKRMHGALRDADFSTALALSAEHARRWPRGVFELEREGVRAIASCGIDTDDAALRAKRFLAAHPHAPVAMRVNAACASQLAKR